MKSVIACTRSGKDGIGASSARRLSGGEWSHDSSSCVYARTSSSKPVGTSKAGDDIDVNIERIGRASVRRAATGRLDSHRYVRKCAFYLLRTRAAVGANNEKPEHTTAVRVVGVRAEHRADGLGLGTPEPRLSWRTETTRPSWVQASYEVRALDDDGATVAESGVVDSADSVLVPWPGAALTSRQRCSVQVRVTGADGVPSDWSEPAAIETGLLDVRDWSAGFVGPAWDEDTSSPQPVPYLRREFVVEHDVERARLYATALGVYEIEVNGARVGDHVLAPGWSSYAPSAALRDLRRHADGADRCERDRCHRRRRLVPGLARRRPATQPLRRPARVPVPARAHLRRRLGDGDHDRRALARRRRARFSRPASTRGRPTTRGWSSRAGREPGFDDATWSPVVPVEHDLGTLVARDGPPVRAIERVQPVEILRSPSGRCIVDFGQNLVGRVELSVSGTAGETVTLRHAEVLQDGELCTEPLRSAEATDHYTLRGDGEEVWQPRFTFHGFRYVDVAGWPGEVAAENLTAVVLHSDMERTGWFECSDERVNRLHENIVWGMRGNFLDLPTDCPQRDERLGWTGDINVFAPTASFLYDCAGFLTSWLRELAAEQTPEGVVPWVIPNVLEWLFPTAVWGDAAVVVPATVFERFGDEGVLRAQYPSMRAHGSSTSPRWPAVGTCGQVRSSSPIGSIRPRATQTRSTSAPIPTCSRRPRSATRSTSWRTRPRGSGRRATHGATAPSPHGSVRRSRA